MTVRDRIAAVLAGVLAGACGGFFGVGGGIIIIPILTGYFAATQHRAHGTSLAAIGATALASIAIYGTHGRVEWTTAALAGLSSIFTARLGARAAARVSARQLKLAFAVFLALVAIRLLWWTAPTSHPLMAAGAPRVAVDLAVGAAVGLLAGFMGVGGGIIAVPAFMLLLGMSQHEAQGTSLAVILVTAPVGAWEHARHGNVLGRLVGWLAGGAAVGALLSATLVQGTPAPILTRAFAIFLLFSAFQTAWRSIRSDAPTPSKAR
jgi:uncharacterized membrane protein YfcA